MKFLLLHYVDETNEMSAEESREDRALLASWLEDTIARGVNLQGSYLQPSRNAATIRARDGELLLTDGPFAETKEQIAGFDIIECADMQEALRVAGVELGEEPRHVGLDGGDAEGKAGGDLGVGQAAPHQGQDFPLAVQRRDV